MKALLRILLLILAIVFGLACEKRDGSTSKGSSTTPAPILRLPVIAATAVDTLDPIQSVEAVQYNIINQIFEGLVGIDKDGQFVPALAERWEHSDDFRVWRFFLRDARFADDACFPGKEGRKITGADVLYSLKRGLSPGLGSKNSWALSRSVLGAKEFAESKVPDVAGLRCPTADTIEIELVGGDRFFLAALTVPATYVVPHEAVQKYGQQFGTHPVGSGPFCTSEWLPGQHLTLKRNGRYGIGTGWQPQPASVREARFVFYRSEAQVLAEFGRGMLDVRPVLGSDVAASVDGDLKASLQTRNPDSVVVQPGWVCKVHLLAVAIGPDHVLGSNAEARRALSQLMPRQQIEAGALRGTGKPQETILPAVLCPPSHRPNPPEPLADAQAVLRAALNGRAIRVAYVSSRTDEIIIEALKGVIEGAGGRAQLFPSTSVNTLFGSLPTTKPDLTLIYWSPYFPSVPDYLTALLSASRPVPNFTGFADERLDRLAAELRSATGRDAPIVIAEVDAVLGQTMPWIPLYIETPLFLVSRRLDGFTISPVSAMQLRTLRLQDEP